MKKVLILGAGMVAGPAIQYLLDKDYEVILERHRRSSTILTSNRDIEEWIPLFDDPILAQSALDRLAHNAYQVVIEGDSYRSRQRPGIAASTPPRKSRK